MHCCWPTLQNLLTSNALDPRAAFALVVFGFFILSLAARYRTAVNYDGARLFAFPPEWNKMFLKTSMAHSTIEAYEHVRQLDHPGRIVHSPSEKKHKAATASLCDAIQKRDFAAPSAASASEIFGPISRHFIAQIFTHDV